MCVITPSATALLQSEQIFGYWTTLFLIIAASTSRDSPRIHIMTDSRLNLLGYALCCQLLGFRDIHCWCAPVQWKHGRHFDSIFCHRIGILKAYFYSIQIQTPSMHRLHAISAWNFGTLPQLKNVPNISVNTFFFLISVKCRTYPQSHFTAPGPKTRS